MLKSNAHAVEPIYRFLFLLSGMGCRVSTDATLVQLVLTAIRAVIKLIDCCLACLLLCRLTVQTISTRRITHCKRVERLSVGTNDNGDFGGH